jgi:ribosomal protein S18 acetylase RimI-like enzyme
MSLAFSRLTYSAERRDDLVAFCLQHSTTGHPPDLIRRLIGLLPADDSAVFDVHSTDDRCLVGVVLDTLDNRDNAAVFDVLGWTGQGTTTDLWPWVLDLAESRVRSGTRSTISFALCETTAALAPWLLERGYHLGFTCYGMATDPIAPPAVPPVPPGWRWETLDEGNVRAYYDAAMAAMGDVPGTNFASYADFVPMALQAAILPRLLYDGDRVAGFFRVSLTGATQDGGYISSIGRTPAYRGQQLGPLLLATAMTLLARHGARHYALDVSATNDRALALYERHGFHIVSHEPHYLRDLLP